MEDSVCLLLLPFFRITLLLFVTVASGGASVDGRHGLLLSQHENKAVSSRFADLPATLCVAVYYHGQRTAELVRQQSFGCVADLSFPLLPKADW